jgi:hypothetical protein
MAGKKETVLDLGKFIDKGVRVKLSGGREGASCAHHQQNKSPFLSERRAFLWASRSPQSTTAPPPSTTNLRARGAWGGDGA